MRISDWSSDVCSSDLEGRTRRETDLVIDDEMDAAAGVVAGHARKTEAFPHDALPRKGGVAVDQHRQHLLVLGQIVAVDLLRAYLAEHDRIDRLEVRGVGDERDRKSTRLNSSH